jgi:hypothetical protein
MTLRELPKEALERGAIVYIRQSTGAQVQENLESQRRQYELVELARRYGFCNVAVIDADLGSIWQSSSSDMRTKQRLTRALIEEIVVDVDDDKREVVLVTCPPGPSRP